MVGRADIEFEADLGANGCALQETVVFVEALTTCEAVETKRRLKASIIWVVHINRDAPYTTHIYSSKSQNLISGAENEVGIDLGIKKDHI